MRLNSVFYCLAVSHKARVDKGQVRSRLHVGIRQGCQGGLRNEPEKRRMTALMDPRLSGQASIGPR